MKLLGKKKDRNNGGNNGVVVVEDAVAVATPAPPAAPVPPATPKTTPQLHFTARSPWSWVLRKMATSESIMNSFGCARMVEALLISELPSSQIELDASPEPAAAAAAPPSSSSSSGSGSSSHHRRRGGSSLPKLRNHPCTLRVEITDNSESPLRMAVHGTSAAFDGLEDKDELVRTIQRCRCEELNISPTSILIKWDVTKDECNNVVGSRLPSLHDHEDTNNNTNTAGTEPDIAVLKAPLGSRGEGIYFVGSIDEMYEIIEANRDKTYEAGQDFLENIIATKGRIPSWVLQAEIRPPLLITDGRKFHIRTYVVVVEKLYHEDMIDVYMYNRHEVRIAAERVSDQESIVADSLGLTGSKQRGRLAHITNGASSELTERVLLQDVEELMAMNMQDKVNTFVAQAFGRHFVPDMIRRVARQEQMVQQAAARNASPSSSSSSSAAATPFPTSKFAMAGVDLMVTKDGRLYLLEVNNNPAAPPAHLTKDPFADHLVGYMTDLVGLVLGLRNMPDTDNPTFPQTCNFIHANDILNKEP
eukprot:scaffold24666_cov49-Attheya_sp.AAC.3